MKDCDLCGATIYNFEGESVCRACQARIAARPTLVGWGSPERMPPLTGRGYMEEARRIIATAKALEESCD